MPELRSNLGVEEKLDLLLWQGIQQAKTLADIQEVLVTVSSEQADFNADITALANFLNGLPAQVTAIQTALENQGITDVAPLDALAEDVNNLAPQFANLPGGSGTTPPPVSGPSPSGTTPSAA